MQYGCQNTGVCKSCALQAAALSKWVSWDPFQHLQLCDVGGLALQHVPQAAYVGVYGAARLVNLRAGQSIEYLDSWQVESAMTHVLGSHGSLLWTTRECHGCTKKRGVLCILHP